MSDNYKYNLKIKIWLNPIFSSFIIRMHPELCNNSSSRFFRNNWTKSIAEMVWKMEKMQL